MFEYLTQQEVYSQPEALKKTLDYLLENRKKSPDFSAATKEEELWSWAVAPALCWPEVPG